MSVNGKKVGHPKDCDCSRMSLFEGENIHFPLIVKNKEREVKWKDGKNDRLSSQFSNQSRRVWIKRGIPVIHSHSIN